MTDFNFTDPADRARFLKGTARDEALQVLCEDELWWVWENAQSPDLKQALRDEFGRRARNTYL